jgi:hypothetical protein
MCLMSWLPGPTLALVLTLMVSPASAADTQTLAVRGSELADKLNDRFRIKDLRHRAVEIYCAITYAAKCRYHIGEVVVLTTVAAAPDAPIWGVVAVYTAARGLKQQLAAIAIYTVLMEVLSPRSTVKDRSIALGNLISGLLNFKQETDAELDGVKYHIIAAGAGEVWLIATPTK